MLRVAITRSFLAMFALRSRSNAVRPSSGVGGGEPRRSSASMAPLPCFPSVSSSSSRSGDRIPSSLSSSSAACVGATSRSTSSRSSASPRASIASGAGVASLSSLRPGGGPGGWRVSSRSSSPSPGWTASRMAAPRFLVVAVSSPTTPGAPGGRVSAKFTTSLAHPNLLPSGEKNRTRFFFIDVSTLARQPALSLRPVSENTRSRSLAVSSSSGSGAAA
mmetsp:Transcript_13823/g.60374  ORF Transcript_13823/g.60374 Transcript_13823/m.60374 type:complete len:219 (-) Transcript_13823:359-1015(-)